MPGETKADPSTDPLDAKVEKGSDPPAKADEKQSGDGEPQKNDDNDTHEDKHTEEGGDATAGTGNTDGSTAGTDNKDGKHADGKEHDIQHEFGEEAKMNQDPEHKKTLEDMKNKLAEKRKAAEDAAVVLDDEEGGIVDVLSRGYMFICAAVWLLLLVACVILIRQAPPTLEEPHLLITAICISCWLLKSLGCVFQGHNDDPEHKNYHPTQSALDTILRTCDPFMFLFTFYYATEFDVRHMCPEVFYLKPEVQWAGMGLLHLVQFYGLSTDEQASSVNASKLFCREMPRIVTSILLVVVSICIWNRHQWELMLVGCVALFTCVALGDHLNIGYMALFFCMLATEFQLRTDLRNFYV